MARNGVWFILGGLLLTVVAWNEGRQSAGASAEPQTITCAQLSIQGFGDNSHVRMTDFCLCDHGYVYEEKFQWTKAWVPVVPRGSALHQAILARDPAGNSDPTPGKEINLIVLLPKPADRPTSGVPRSRSPSRE